MITYIRSLEFEETPDYNFLHSMLLEIRYELNLGIEKSLDWNIQGYRIGG
jgi:hypothetical protein